MRAGSANWGVVVTAPDPGLTDLIAAHLTELIADSPAPNHEEDNYDAGYVAALADLRDSAAFKLVVEQHTQTQTARIAELEDLAYCQPRIPGEDRELYRDRFRNQMDAAAAEVGRIAELEATIARVIEGAQMLVESFQRVERGGNHLYDASTHRCADNLALLLAEAQGPEHLRAALEGES